MVKKILLALVVVLLVAILAAVTMEFDSPKLGQGLLAQASAASGVELTASSFRLKLLKGLELGDVTAKSAFPGGRYEVKLDSLLFEHRLAPLLSGTLAVDRVVLERPEVVLVQGIEESAPPPTEEPGAAEPAPSDVGEPEQSESAGSGSGSGSGFELEVKEISIVDGSVVVLDAASDAETLALTGLELGLRDLRFQSGALTPLHALTANGAIAFSSLMLDGTNVEDAEGSLSGDAGRFAMEDLSFRTEQGSFRATMALDFNSLPFRYEMTLEGDPVDVNRIAGTPEGEFGSGRLSFEATGFGTDSKNVQGQGVLHLAAGRLPSSQAVKTVEMTLGRTDLVGAPYEDTSAPFRVENNHVILESFRLDTPQAGLDLEGSVDLDGPLDFRLTLRTPRAGLQIKEIPNEALDALTDDEGFVSLPYAIAGTTEEPRVRLDSGALMAQFRAGTKRVVQEKLQEQAIEGLKSLFGRKKKK
jgi:hypothetical protein